MEGQHEAPTRGWWMASGLYDALKWFALIALPLLGAAYFSLADLWNLPKAEEVVGTCAIIGTLLGGLLRVSHNSYEKSDAKYDGEVAVVPDLENETTDLNVRLDPNNLGSKKVVLLKVNHLS